MRRATLMRDLVRSDAWAELEAWLTERIEAEKRQVVRDVKPQEEYIQTVATVKALQSVLSKPQRWIEKGDEILRNQNAPP